MNTREELTRRQREVLQEIVDSTLEHHCSPTASYLKERMGRDIRGPLEEMKRLGYIVQPFPRGPYAPVRDVDGRPLRTTILPQDIAQEAESKAYRRK